MHDTRGPNNTNPTQGVVFEAALGPGFDVFISYRVRPDEPLAQALKELLEKSMDPQPRVFVSGRGGLRASADGYRQQLGNAARTAKAYVGVITDSSVEREWIFFEAGAAFGRGVLYAPLLFGIAASALPSSLGGYQAVSADDQDRVQDLVSDVAGAIGAKPKAQFGRRFARFRKDLEVLQQDEIGDEVQGTRRAIALYRAGREEEADALFAQLIEECHDDSEQSASLRLTQLVLSRADDDDFLSRLRGQPEDVQATAIWRFWMGIYETNPLAAYELLREANDGDPPGYFRKATTLALAKVEWRLGHTKQSTERLLAALRAEDRELRSDAAQQLAGHLEQDQILSKLLLLTEATVLSTAANYRATWEHCWENKLAPLAVYFAARGVAKRDDGDSRLNRGLARELAGLHSLEFRDFRVASERGESVARSNMAALLNSRPVPEAGLEILRAHEGGFNSADPGQPYETRAELERAIKVEEDREKELQAYGGQVVTALHRLIHSWRQLAGDEACDGNWKAITNFGHCTATVAGESVSVTLGGQVCGVEPLSPLPRIYAAKVGAEVRMFVLVGSQPLAFTLEGLDKLGKVRWIDFNAADEHFEPRVDVIDRGAPSELALAAVAEALGWRGSE